MAERYQYPPLYIIYPYVLVLLLPAILIFGWFKANANIHDDGFLLAAFLLAAFFWAFNLVLAGSTILWIVNNLTVRIEINDVGLLYHSALKKKTILWSNIVDIQRRIFDERLEWYNDLIIRLHDGKKIKIYGIVCRSDGKEGGITELESILRSKSGASNIDPEQQKKRQYRSVLLLCTVFGTLCFILGVHFILHPLQASKEKLGFISNAIGISADGLLLLIIGAGLAAWAAFRIRNQSKCSDNANQAQQR